MPNEPVRGRAALVRLAPVLALALTLPARALAQAADFTLIALPDTQYYTCNDGGSCAGDQGIFDAQLAWIADQRDARNIRYVASLGDCVQNGDVTSEYVIADGAYRKIEAATGSGYPDGIPFGVAVGNHDQAPTNDPGSLPSATDVGNPSQGTTTSMFNDWFGVDRFCSGAGCRSYYGDHFGTNNDDHYDLFSASGYDFLVLSLEFMPSDSPLRQAVLSWADDVLWAHPDRRAIVVSHYLIGTGSNAAFGDEGRAIYDALKDHPKLFLMLGGHIPGEGSRSDTTQGHTVNTLLSDYQSRSHGGSGWLRVLEFHPSRDEISVRTYSPWLDQWETDGDSQFTLAYDMNGGYPDGCVDPEHDGVCNPTLSESGVVRGQTATLTLSGATPGATALFVATAKGDGGPTVCHPTASVCTTLKDPQVLGSVPVDGTGSATLQVSVPDALPAGTVLSVQGAWILGASGQVSEVDTVTVP